MINLNRDKRGQTFNIFVWIIAGFLCVVLFAGLIYTMGIINDTMHQVGVTNDQNPTQNFTFPCPDNQSNICSGSTYVNMTQASDNIFGQVNTSIQALRMVAIVYILGLAVVIIISNSLIKLNPIFFFAYILICLLAVIFAPTISNAYYNLLQTNMMNGILTSFTSANYVLLNLPTITLIISVLGGIFLFISFIKNSDQERSLQ